MEQEHKRRVRYAGTHPRTFQEKYKELNPEKYQQEVEKLLRKGKTPAGMHIPICVEEILSFLEIQPGQIGLDATLGYGGHSRRMLEALRGRGISTPQMWTPSSLKRPVSAWNRRGMARRFSPSDR